MDPTSVSLIINKTFRKPQQNPDNSRITGSLLDCKTSPFYLRNLHQLVGTFSCITAIILLTSQPISQKWKEKEHSNVPYSNVFNHISNCLNFWIFFSTIWKLTILLKFNLKFLIWNYTGIYFSLKINCKNLNWLYLEYWNTVFQYFFYQK